jgi:hypothetical protein
VERDWRLSGTLRVSKPPCAPFPDVRRKRLLLSNRSPPMRRIARSITKALDGEFDAVFYTVDIHGLFKPRKHIRTVMFQGCLNSIHAAAQAGVPPKFVLLSVIGPDQPSWVWWVLNATKPGMQRNILDRERVLKDSGLSYVICRAAKLNNEAGGTVPVAATPPQHALDMKRGIPRAPGASLNPRCGASPPERNL